jgi:hypothetical protein
MPVHRKRRTMTDKSDRQTKKPSFPESSEFYERVKRFFADLRDEEKPEQKFQIKVGYPFFFSKYSFSTSYITLTIKYLRNLLSQTLQINQKQYFGGLIIIKVIRRRIVQLLMFGAIIIIIYLVNDLWWPLFIPVGLIVADVVLMLYRQRRGLYGNNDLEFREAVRYVIDENRSGRGPGDFEHVFPVVERKMGQEPDALPARP